MASRVILCLNSGSSSLKLALYEIGDGKEDSSRARCGRGATMHKAPGLWINSPQRKIEKNPGGETVYRWSAALHGSFHRA